MLLRDVATPELRRMVKATEQTVGRDSRTVEILRRELVRREGETLEKRQEVPREHG